jgi:quinol monooxygenase YgiN
VTFLPHQVQEDPNTVLIYEQYRDDQALAAHRDSAHFKKYVVAGLYQKMKERNLENLIALV